MEKQLALLDQALGREKCKTRSMQQELDAARTEVFVRDYV